MSAVNQLHEPSIRTREYAQAEFGCRHDYSTGDWCRYNCIASLLWFGVDLIDRDFGRTDAVGECTVVGEYTVEERSDRRCNNRFPAYSMYTSM